MAKQQSTLEGMAIGKVDTHFWKGKHVFITGHTSFGMVKKIQKTTNYLFMQNKD